ncbi:unnamed protein product [Trichogramma brassicae]|uniref:Uncharacterized protein n=1 Tax=Trichogramma brassicae TaxID=86971 RepID=A0A6H5ITU1_9HYME|nr:unnamed protein product [Trichogramma brassicae]
MITIKFILTIYQLLICAMTDLFSLVSASGKCVCKYQKYINLYQYGGVPPEINTRRIQIISIKRILVVLIIRGWNVTTQIHVKFDEESEYRIVLRASSSMITCSPPDFRSISTNFNVLISKKTLSGATDGVFVSAAPSNSHSFTSCRQSTT